MKLVFLNSPLGTFTPTHSGAIATIIWELCRRARDEAIEPVVVSRSSDIEPYGGVRTVFVDYPAQPSGGPGLFMARARRKLAGWTHLRQATYARRVAAALRDNALLDHQVVMFNDPEMAAFLRRRFPNLFILHWFQNQLPSKPPARRAFGRSANRIAAVSDFTSRWVEEYYHLPGGTVKTLYNAVDAERFSPAEAPPDSPPVINFVGRTGIEKAPDLLLKAALRLSRRTKNFSLQIVGANHWGRLEMDDYQRQLQSLSAELAGAGVTVRMTGHIDRAALPAEIRKAHIHVVPSRWDEPCALAILEGMATGLATTASATGGTPELIGDAGLLFDRDSVDGLAENLHRLVTSESDRRNVASRCRQRAAGFTWNRTWNTLKEMLNSEF
jgi:glycosyltransferase involved in cell wall biosynthesis